MKLLTSLTTVILSVAFISAAPVSAKECSDIEWSMSVLEEYAQIADACQGIVEVNGKEYAELEAKFVRSVGDQVRIKFKQNDGTWGPTYQTRNLNKDFQVTMDGERLNVHKLQRDSIMELHVPTDRFFVMGSFDDTADQYAMVDNYDYDMLPSTASSLGLMLLLAMGAFVAAFSVRKLRQ